MGIKFSCPHCGRSLHVKSNLAGRRGLCPHCGGRLEIPRSNSATPTQPSPTTAKPVMAGSETPAKSPEIPRLDGGAKSPSAAFPAAATHKTPQVAGTSQPTARVLAPQAFEDLDPNSFLLERPNVEFAGAQATVFDWIADAPEAVWYVRNRAGGQYGPAVGAVMRTWLHEGRVSRGCYVWREGWANWRQASDVFPHLFNPSPFVPAMEPAAPPSPRTAQPSVRASWSGPAAAAAGMAPTADGPNGPELPTSQRRRNSAALFAAILLFVLTVSGVAITTIAYFWKMSNEVQAPATEGDTVPEIRDPFAK